MSLSAVIKMRIISLFGSPQCGTIYLLEVPGKENRFSGKLDEPGAWSQNLK